MQSVAWALSWRGCCNTDEGRACGQQAGCQSGAGIRHARQGYLVESEAPRASSQMPIAQDGRCAYSPLSVICLGGIQVDENSLALCLWYTIVLWTDGRQTRFSSWVMWTQKLLLQPASRGHAVVAEAHTYLTQLCPSLPPPSSAWGPRGRREGGKARFGLGSRCLLTSL